MKKTIKLNFVFLVKISLFLLVLNVQQTNAQDIKKNKIRLKVDYVKTMNEDITFIIKASSKVERKNIDVANIEVTIFNEINGEKIKIGTITTNMEGASKFVVKDFNLIKPDSTGLYNITATFKGNDLYKRASKSISYKDAIIIANITTIDSINYVTATIKDTAKDSLLSDQILNVQVQRLFKPLRIGKEFNSTDEFGSIIVPVEDGIPGVNGMLTFEVVLKENDDYGTVKALISAPLGIPIVDESTFDERTMWSPRNKTPLFLLIVPNIITLGIWGIIIYLLLNLIKIKKS